MAIYVHVKHYLNDDGFAHFDDWFSRVEKFMSAKDGYISLQHTKYPEENMVHIVLAFESVVKLEAWISEPVHDDLVNELDQYRSRDYWEAARTEDKNADWRKIKYDEIKA